jgi:hypothetical protein
MPPVGFVVARYAITAVTRENGFNGWIAFDPTPVWRVELGLTRSATFDLNSFAFSLRMNLGKLARARRIS